MDDDHPGVAGGGPCRCRASSVIRPGGCRQRLVAEYGAEVAESTVRAYVAQVNFELDNTLWAVTVPQTHGPGEEAECDFGEFMAWIEGVLVKCWMFCLRLSHSGRGFHVAFCHQAQEAFFEGHVLAFAHFGGVPARIRYDNLKAAVVKVLLGRDRLENERFVALRSHYGFDSFYCLPGIEGSHEKGGVEGEVGQIPPSSSGPGASGGRPGRVERADRGG